MVIAATGFRISFPFLDRALVDFAEGEVPLFLRTFHPRFRDLFFIGLPCTPTSSLRARSAGRSTTTTTELF